jgi:hypothetical protein
LLIAGYYVFFLSEDPNTIQVNNTTDTEPLEGSNTLKEYPETANATVTYSQSESDKSGVLRNVTIELEFLNGADYVIVDIEGTDANRFVNISERNVSGTRYGQYVRDESIVIYNLLTPENVPGVPRNTGETSLFIEGTKGAILTTPGDKAIVTDVRVGENITVWRVDGSSTYRIGRYRVGSVE